MTDFSDHVTTPERMMPRKVRRFVRKVRDAARKGREVRVLYTKENGETAKRTVRPESVWVSSEGQVLMTGHDAYRMATRSFRADRAISARLARRR